MDDSKQGNRQGLLRWLAAAGILAAGGWIYGYLRRRSSQLHTQESRPVNAPASGNVDIEAAATTIESSVPEPVAVTVDSGLSARRLGIYVAGLLLFVVLIGVLQERAPEMALALFGGVILFGLWGYLRPVIRYLWPRLLVRLRPVVRLFRRFYYWEQPADSPSASSILQSRDWIVSAILTGWVLLIPVFFMDSAALGMVAIIAGVIPGLWGWLMDWDLLAFPRWLASRMRTMPAIEQVRLAHVPWWVMTVEVIVLVIVTLHVTRPFHETPAHWQLSGHEAEWLTHTIYSAYDGFKTMGRIPLWQPFMEQGEPLVENPFSFIFNPVTGLPSLLLGPVSGLRVSVMLSVFLAGLGGWFLGRMLGLSWFGRVLLGLLLIGKGNMHAALNSSYFQLAVSQVYMPWVIGGVIAILRLPKRRWPIILTVLSITLQFFTGNIWYVLPTVVGGAVIAFGLMVGANGKLFERQTLRRFMITMGLTAGLSAVMLLPVVVNFNRIGRHPPEVDAGWVVPVRDVVPLFFDPDPNRMFELRFENYYNEYVEWTRRVGDFDEFYYSFVVPAWFVLLIVLIPLYRPVLQWERRFWVLAFGLMVLAILWGAGGQVPYLWAYRNLPFINQWRFVGRALAVASFWLCILLAIRADKVWRYAVQTEWGRFWGSGRQRVFRWVVPVGAAGVLLAGSIQSVSVATEQWYKLEGVVRERDARFEMCAEWLRERNPDDDLVVMQGDYDHITALLDRHIRNWVVQADFGIVPNLSTIGDPNLNLNSLFPEFMITANKDERQWAVENGYVRHRLSPVIDDGQACIYRRPDFQPYAYTIPQDALVELGLKDQATPPNLFTPILSYTRRYDQIAVVVAADEAHTRVVGVQERAYPGWQVMVNGEPARLESVGGQIGVVVPAGKSPVEIYFVYRPFLLLAGGFISLICAAAAIVYLVRQPIVAEVYVPSNEPIWVGRATISRQWERFAVWAVEPVTFAPFETIPFLSRWKFVFRPTTPLTWLGIFCMLLAAYLMRSGIEGDDVSHQLILSLGMGVLLIGGMLLVSGKRIHEADEKEVTRLSGIRVYWVPFAAGMLALLTLVGLNLLPTLVGMIHYRVQLGLLLIGAVGVGWGLIGQWRLPRIARREWIAIAGIALVGLSLRLVMLDSLMPRFGNELSSMQAIVRLWNDPYPSWFLQQHAGFDSSWVATALQIVPVDLFGHHLLGLRLLSGIMGGATVIAVYLLARTLAGDGLIAIVAAMIMATLPVHLHFSRLGLDVVHGVFWGTLALAFMGLGWRRGYQGDFAFAGVLLGITLYFSGSERLLFPLLALIWLVVMIWRGRSVEGRVLLVSFGLVALPFFNSVLSNQTDLLGGLVRESPELIRAFNPFLPTSGYPALETADTLMGWPVQLLTAVDRSGFYGGNEPVIIGYLLPVFLMGVTALGWRIRSLFGGISLGWIGVTVVGSLVLDARQWVLYTGVMLPAFALILAAGIYYPTAILLQSRRWRSVIVVVIGVVAAGGQAIYYFNAHVPSLERQAQLAVDWSDALLRMDGLPASTRVHMVTKPVVSERDLQAYVDFADLKLDVDIVSPEMVTEAYLRKLDPRDTHAFFVNLLEGDVVTRLREHFELDGPQLSPRNIDPIAQLALYVTITSDE